MKECAVLLNNDKSFWYQDIDFKTAFLLSKSRSFKKSAPRPELIQIVTATKFPEFHFINDRQHHGILFIGAKQHINSDWILLYDDQIIPTSAVIENLKKNLISLNIKSLKILADSPDIAKTEKSLESGLKSSFPTTTLVYWPR